MNIIDKFINVVMNEYDPPWATHKLYYTEHDYEYAKRGKKGQFVVRYNNRWNGVNLKEDYIRVEKI